MAEETKLDRQTLAAVWNALAFYANEWRDVGGNGLGHAGPAMVPTHQLSADYGGRAKKALDALAEKMK